MKSTYDDPRNPLYHVVRSPGGLTTADMLNDVRPETVEQIQRVSSDLNNPELYGQFQRQYLSRMYDPTGVGDLDLDGFAKRWQKVGREKVGAVLPSDHIEALDNIAARVQEPTPYDGANTQLKKLAHAADDNDVAEILNSPLPETMRGIRAAADALADHQIVPQIQRHVAESIINPESNEVPDLKNLPTRFKRVQKQQLGGVLPPETIEDLDTLARTAKTVNWDDNPSGTAKTLQPVAEAASLGAAATGMLTGLATGNPIHAIAATAPVALSLARGAGAKLLASPTVVDTAMAPRTQLPASTFRPAAAVQALGGANEREATNNEVVEGLGATQANPGTPPPDKPGMTPADYGPSATTAPPGATHEVLSPDGSTVTGHVVAGQYVPLDQKQSNTEGVTP